MLVTTSVLPEFLAGLVLQFRGLFFEAIGVVFYFVGIDRKIEVDLVGHWFAVRSGKDDSAAHETSHEHND
jgi:hypothetical protein